MTGGCAFYDTFAAAVCDPALPPPDGLKTRENDSTARGFSVYRNNVVVSLVDALAERFPVCERLVSTAFFRAMTQDFIIVSPPTSPLMMTYGDDFADFIAAFPPAAALPYLADVARLEAARTRAYHAADAEPLPASAFAARDGAALAACRTVLHPSTELLSAQYAAATIWAAHQHEDLPQDVDPNAPEDILIARPRIEVETRRLPSGVADFIAALASGMTLADAAHAAHSSTADFDPTEALAAVIAAEIVTEIHH